MERKHAERFADLIAVLRDETPDEAFTMEWWASRDAGCGTAGCAFGNYAIRRPSSGLRIKWIPRRPSEPWEPAELAIVLDPTRPGIDGYELAAEHFGVSAHSAYKLFNPWAYGPEERTRTHVLARIEDYYAAHAGTAREAA